MKISMMVLIAILVSGCAFNTLNKGLPLLVGKPLNAAVDVLGLPNQRMEVGPYTVYVWNIRYSSTIPIYNTSTSTTTGSIGTVPIYGTTTSSSLNYIPVRNQCQIELQVDSNNIIRRWQWFGNQGGCKFYANGLERIIPN